MTEVFPKSKWWKLYLIQQSKKLFVTSVTVEIMTLIKRVYDTLSASIWGINTSSTYFYNNSGASARAKPHRYRKWKPIDARKFGYDVSLRPLSVRPYNSGGRGKKLSRIGRGVSDVYVAFHFGAKLTILGATIGNKFLRLWLLLGHAFGHNLFSPLTLVKTLTAEFMRENVCII